MLKCSRLRWVCAPQYLLAGTSTSPRLSNSRRIPVACRPIGISRICGASSLASLMIGTLLLDSLPASPRGPAAIDDIGPGEVAARGGEDVHQPAERPEREQRPSPSRSPVTTFPPSSARALTQMTIGRYGTWIRSPWALVFLAMLASLAGLTRSA